MMYKERSSASSAAQQPGSKGEGGESAAGDRAKRDPNHVEVTWSDVRFGLVVWVGSSASSAAAAHLNHAGERAKKSLRYLFFKRL
jgi:hypothetical protein